MANKIYPKYKQALIDGASDVALDTGTVKAILVDLADYTYSDAHDFLDDVPSGARVATSGALASKTITDGTFDAADFSFTAVTGDVSEALIIFIDTGNEATSRLVAFYDTGVTGLPITPNGADINVAINASGLFSL
jgi:hypothetical protein